MFLAMTRLESNSCVRLALIIILGPLSVSIASFACIKAMRAWFSLPSLIIFSFLHFRLIIIHETSLGHIVVISWLKACFNTCNTGYVLEGLLTLGSPIFDCVHQAQHQG